MSEKQEMAGGRHTGMPAGLIYLIGFMGCGKSTVSRLLAERLSVERLEMDEMLVQQAGKPVTKIFEEDGEEAFRLMESQLICRIGAGKPAVVSCGGGAALRQENVRNMKASGTIVLLSASPETIFGRVRHSTHRPILNGHMNVDYIAELMGKREPFYREAADVIVPVDGKTPEQVTEEILKAVNDFNRQKCLGKQTGIRKESVRTG